MFQGDSHRFGAVVERIQQHSTDFFVKPRSTFLEFIFNSNESPWKNFFQGFFLSSDYCAMSFAETSQPWRGSVPSFGPFQMKQLPTDRAQLEFDLGRFLALCTLLGITDIHNENSMYVERNARRTFAPLDLEIAFWNCASGMDTLLFPSRLISRESCGFSSQFGAEFKWNHPERALDGFISGASILKKDLYALLQDLEVRMQNHPNRVLLRPTKVYAQKSSNSWLASEQLQMDAGDIPYYFTYREKNPKLLYFSSASEISEQPLENTDIAGIFKDAIYSCQDLSAPERVEKLIRTTALHFAHSYTEFRIPKISGEFFDLTTTDHLQIVTADFKVAAKIN